MDPIKGGHVARREPRIQSVKMVKCLIWEERSPISDFSNVEREREREREREEGFLRRFTGFRQSKFNGPRTKVHHLDEGYTQAPKKRDFT